MKKYIRTAKSPRYNVDRAFSGNYETRFDYAKRVKDPAALEIYTYDVSAMVRTAVASNVNLPLECMEVLVHDPDRSVVFALSHNKSIPASILADLAKSDFDEVRMSVAVNPNTPEDALRQLTDDREVLISCYAKDNLRKRGISI